MSRRRLLALSMLVLPLAALVLLAACAANGPGAGPGSAAGPEAGPYRAGSPPVRAFPRIETAQHAAPIWRIGVNTAERWLVTTSDDKTARVWDLATGEPVRVLRPPIGDGDEGKLYAAALSPDGGTVAVGGWTGYGWGRSASIYLFDRETGELSHRIGDLPIVVFHLAFSPDGTRLAAALGAEGIRLYRTDNWAEIGRDAAYRSLSSWAAFDAKGRLATTCYDGFVRLYDPNLKLLAKRNVPGGKRPFGLAFSPDGSRVAVGFEDSTAVNVLSGEDLSFLFAPDTADIDNSSLSSVAWSKDGRTLYAGGRYVTASGVQLLTWTDAGRGEPEAGPLATNSIMDLVPLTNDRLVFGSQDPAWGLIDARGGRAVGRGPAIADFRRPSHRLRLSEDGQVAELDLRVLDRSGAWQERVLRIDLAEGRPTLDPGGEIEQIQRRLRDLGQAPGPIDGAIGPRTRDALRAFQRERALPVTGEPDTPTRTALGLPPLSAPLTEAPGLRAADWWDSTAPKRNGKPLELQPFETSYAADIAADGSRLLLGTSFRLRLYDRDGTPIRQVPVPSNTFKVKLSADTRWAVAAFGDGTLRWFDAETGAERLALFVDGAAIARLPPQESGADAAPAPAADAAPGAGRGVPWVLWTPDGFFDAGGGGERLMGWHLNRGPDRAGELIDAGQLGEVFRRKDLVARALDPDYPGLARSALAEIGDLERLLAGGLPPALERLGPREVRQDARTFAARLAVTDRGGGVGRIEYRIDGAVIAQGDLRGRFGLGLPKRREETRPFTLDPGTYSIEARVFDRDGKIASPPVDWEVTVAGETRTRPALYGLAVGIGSYRDATLALRFAPQDAEALATALETAGRELFRAVKVETLTDQEATLAGIVAALESLAAEAAPEDVFVLYLAGHGLVQDGRYRFIPWELQYTNRAALDAGALSEDRLYDLLAQVRALKTLLVLDTCYAGAALSPGGAGGDTRLAGLAGQRGGEALETRAAIDRLMEKTGRAVLASATEHSFALEGLDGHGVFTFALLEGIGGRADLLGNRDGTIEIGELADYLEHEVPRLSRHVWQYEQYPMRDLRGQSFPIGLRRSAGE